MRFSHCFTLIAIMIIMFSLTAVTASENITDDVPLEESISGYALEDVESSDVDLSVRLDVENVFDGEEYNREGYEVPWTITVRSSNGVAHDTKVHTTISDNMEYVSHEASMGTYDPTVNIWDIGDLGGSDNASLILLTKLKSDGKFRLAAYATTSSNDVNLLNNYKNLYIRSGTFPAHVTYSPDNSSNHRVNDINDASSESKDKREIKHTRHLSRVKKSFVQIQKADSSEAMRFDPGALSEAHSYKTVAKTVLNGNDLNESLIGLLDVQVKLASAYDYTQIPLLVFSLFLIILAAFAGYDKIKS